MCVNLLGIAIRLKKLSSLKAHKLFNRYSSLSLSTHGLTRFHLLTEVIHDDIAHVVFVRLGRNQLRSLLKGTHTVVSLHHIIDGCHAILRLRIDGLAVDGGTKQVAILVHNQLYTVAHALSATFGNLLEKALYLFAS